MLTPSEQTAEGSRGAQSHPGLSLSLQWAALFGKRDIVKTWLILMLNRNISGKIRQLITALLQGAANRSQNAADTSFVTLHANEDTVTLPAPHAAVVPRSLHGRWEPQAEGFKHD